MSSDLASNFSFLLSFRKTEEKKNWKRHKKRRLIVCEKNVRGQAS